MINEIQSAVGMISFLIMIRVRCYRIELYNEKICLAEEYVKD